MQLIETKDNHYTAKINEKFIHSKYSPTKEANKFLKDKIENSGTVIVLGAGLGYLYRSIQELYPEVNVIAIPYSSNLQKKALQLNPTKRKEPRSLDFIDSFIQDTINEENIRDIKVVEWQPVAEIYNDISLKVNSLIASRIRLLNGNLLTTARFGKRWLTNTIKNYIEIDNYISSFDIDKPIVIASSGASLSHNIALLKEIRDKIFLIALSSALCALKYNEIKPDLVFSTDPGYYSKLHLYNYNFPLAMPLTNSMSINSPVLLINQGNKFEQDVIDSFKIPNITLGENGTVAGTALQFALKYSKQNIFLIGQDLQSSDIQSHVRPYSFDNLLEKESTRTNPYYSIMYSRLIKQGVTYKTYRDWFSNTAKSYPNRIFRLKTNSTKIDYIPEISQKEFIESIKSRVNCGFKYKIEKNGSRESRRIDALNLLNRWLINLQNEGIEENYLCKLISIKNYTDINNKANSTNAVRESIKFMERLISIYGRKLF